MRFINFGMLGIIRKVAVDSVATGTSGADLDNLAFEDLQRFLD